jgi:type IV pilus assembly protein PilO
LNPALQRFMRLPRSQRFLAAGLLYAAIAAVFYFLLIAPNLDSISAAQGEQTKLVEQRNKVRARAANRSAFEAEAEKLGARLKKALKELPNDREIPGLLSEIDSLARKSGLEVRKFQPLAEVMHEYYAEVPVQIVMDGTFHEFGIFFDRVSDMSRIVSERDIEMGTPKESGSETNLTVSGRTVTYRFLTDAEVKAQQEKQKAKEGKDRKATPTPAAKEK